MPIIKRYARKGKTPQLRWGYPTWLAWMPTTTQISSRLVSLMLTIGLTSIDMDPIPYVDVLTCMVDVPLGHPWIGSWRRHSLEWLGTISIKRILTLDLPHSQSFAKILECSSLWTPSASGSGTCWIPPLLLFQKPCRSAPSCTDSICTG